MPIEAPGRDSEFHTRCHAFAQWFHEHGIAWSGTPTELASELSKNVQTDEVNRVFFDLDQLFAFLEANAQALREFGVDVFLRKASGKPRSISLRTIPQEAKTTQATPPTNASVDQQSNMDTSGNELALGTPNDGYEELDTLRAKIIQTNKAGQAKKSAPKLVETAPPTDAVKEVGIAEKYEPIDSFRPTRLLPLVLLIAIFIMGFFIVRSLQIGTPRETPVTTQADPQYSQSSPGEHTRRPEEKTARTDGVTARTKSNPMVSVSAPEVGAEISTLTREAVEQRKGASQYELGMRYTHGQGVKPDKVVGYAWLVLARSNGDPRSEGTLRALTPQLSPTELQKVRLVLGDWHARGFGVPTDYVAAHSWFTLAEVAGAAEAKIRKKQIEERMSPRQIQDANTRTTAWLSRH
jgi:hypothetical protein